MTKRILAAFLWFYTGWYAGAMLAEILGVSPVLGPIIGAAAAGLIVGDPRGMIWKRRPSGASAPVARLPRRSTRSPPDHRRPRTDTPGPQARRLRPRAGAAPDL